MAALNFARIISLLGSDAAAINLQLVETMDSTNQHLLMLADQGATSGICLVAQHQTAGRGRQGRHWLSHPEGSLTFSLLWRFEGGAAQLSGLALVVSLAVARALDAFGVDGVALKWPNDLLRHGRKIAGVLVEISDGADGTVGAVIGIGLNVVLDEALSDCLLNPATDLKSQNPTPEREVILAGILHELLPLLRQFTVSGFGPLQTEWMARSIHQNRVVSLTLPDRRTEVGEVSGVDRDGALLLKQGDTVQRFLAGDVSLRVA